MMFKYSRHDIYVTIFIIYLLRIQDTDIVYIITFLHVIVICTMIDNIFYITLSVYSIVKQHL